MYLVRPCGVPFVLETKRGGREGEQVVGQFEREEGEGGSTCSSAYWRIVFKLAPANWGCLANEERGSLFFRDATFSSTRGSPPARLLVYSKLLLTIRHLLPSEQEGMVEQVNHDVA